MTSHPPISAVFNLPPEETVRAFDARGDLRTTVKWSEMWHEDHARAFTVAKVAKLDLLETIRTSLADVVHNGGTFEQWKANIIPDLQRAGWWGRVEDKELTGTSQPVFVGPRRLRTIYDTNLRVSRAAGLWARIQELKDIAPFLRYSAILDSRTRPLHRAWHGTILSVDDPWWDTHFPPCGWNCRCTVIQLSERDLQGQGWTVAKQPPPAGPPSTFWRAGAEQPVAVPAGIDPGFAYNPGKTSMRAIADKSIVALEREARHDLGGARAVLRGLVDSPAFLKALDEAGTGFPVMLLDQQLRDRIGARSSVVVLSSETFAKQRRNHPEIGPAQYRRLPEVGAAPDMVFQQDDQRLILMRTADGRWLKAVTKVTADRDETFLVSFAWADAKEVKRLQRRYPLLFGSAAGSVAALIASLIGLVEPDDTEELEA